MSKNLDFDPALYNPNRHAPRPNGAADTVEPTVREEEDDDDTGIDTVKPAGRLEELDGQG